MTNAKQKMVEEVPGVDEELAEVVEAVHEGRPLREVFGVDRRTIDSILDNAHSLYERGELEKAETLLEGIISLDDGLFYPHLLLGDVYRKSDRPEAALEEFDRALELSDEEWNLELRAAEIEVSLGREEDAEERVERIRSAESADEAVRRRARVLVGAVAEDEPSTSARRPEAR